MCVAAKYQFQARGMLRSLFETAELQPQERVAVFNRLLYAPCVYSNTVYMCILCLNVANSTLLLLLVVKH